MKLYIDLDYKDRTEKVGSIYNKPKKNEKEIYIRFKAQRTADRVFELDLYHTLNGKHITFTLDETFDISFTGKDILYYVEQRIDSIINQIY